MRTFAAIALPDEVRDRISRVTKDMRSACKSVRWVQAENYHLTLAFYGEVEDDQFETIDAALARHTSNIAAFTLHLTECGAFPNVRKPATVWVGVNTCSELEACHAAAAEAGSAVGIPAEKRKYHPHITIGRVRRGRFEQELAPHLPSAEAIGACEFTVRDVSLFKSSLTPQGAHYDCLKQYPLCPHS